MNQIDHVGRGHTKYFAPLKSLKVSVPDEKILETPMPNRLRKNKFSKNQKNCLKL
jgi:hypothetical protein